MIEKATKCFICGEKLSQPSYIDGGGNFTVLCDLCGWYKLTNRVIKFCVSETDLNLIYSDPAKKQRRELTREEKSRFVLYIKENFKEGSNRPVEIKIRTYYKILDIKK